MSCQQFVHLVLLLSFFLLEVLNAASIKDFKLLLSFKSQIIRLPTFKSPRRRHEFVSSPFVTEVFVFDQDGNSNASHRSSFSKQAVTGSTNPLREVQQVTDVVEKLPRAELPEPFLWAFWQQSVKTLYKFWRRVEVPPTLCPFFFSANKMIQNSCIYNSESRASASKRK